MNIPENLLYTKEHEWVALEGDVATVGITDYAQGELGDIVFVELPKKGDATAAMTSCGSIEAVKAVADINAPFSGEVTEVNSGLESDPQLINQDPYGQGWMLKIKLTDIQEKDQLLSSDAYKELIA